MIRYIVFVFLLVSCNSNERIDEIQSISDSIKKRYAPDGRVSLYNIEILSSFESITIRGETNIYSAKEDLIDNIEFLGIKYFDSLVLLPN